jgi:hypothetical protein
MDPLTIAILFGTSAASVLVGAWAGRRRAFDEARDEIHRVTERDRRQIRRLDGRGDILERELAELRRRQDLLVSFAESAPVDHRRLQPERPTARTFNAVIERLRGLAAVRDAVVVDEDGLVVTRCDDEATSRMAACVAPLAAASPDDRPLSGIIALEAVTTDATHWTFRRLAHDAHTSWLLVSATSRPVNPVALDVAVAASAIDPGVASSRGPREFLQGAFTAASDNGLGLGDELERSRILDLAVLEGERVVAQASRGGLGSERVARFAEELSRLRGQVEHRAPRGLVSLRVSFADGVQLTLAPSPDDRARALLVVTVDQGIDELALRRLQGRLRRLSISSSQPVGAVAS